MPNEIDIVIVDDQKSYCNSISKLLSEYNINTVGQSANGLEVLELLKSITPDVVLLDLEMPEMDGSKTLDIIRKDYPDLKVIIMTQYDDEQLIKDFFNRGASAYLTKNTDIPGIADAIRIVNASGVYKGNIPALLEAKTISAKRSYYKLIYSKREIEIIRLLCEGKKVSEIGEKFGISIKTVETHLTVIYKKANVRGRSEFLIYAIKEGINFLGIPNANDN